MGALDVVGMCVAYLDVAIDDMSEERITRHRAAEDSAVLCEAACGLLSKVCRGNLLNQRALLLSGAVRRFIILLRSPFVPVQRAVVKTFHTASAQSGKEGRLFQDEVHRLSGVAALLRLMRLTGCSETRSHVLQTLAFTTRYKHTKNQAAFRACGAIKILVVCVCVICVVCLCHVSVCVCVCVCVCVPSAPLRAPTLTARARTHTHTHTQHTHNNNKNYVCVTGAVTKWHTGNTAAGDPGARQV
jgi:hypothetical protein